VFYVKNSNAVKPMQLSNYALLSIIFARF